MRLILFALFSLSSSAFGYLDISKQRSLAVHLWAEIETRECGATRPQANPYCKKLLVLHNQVLSSIKQYSERIRKIDIEGKQAFEKERVQAERLMPGIRVKLGLSRFGTKAMEAAAEGKGTSLVGISGVKTTGRGGNLAGSSRGRGGGLGSRGRVNISIGAVDIEGEIDKAGILRAIRRNRAKFDRCYQFSLQKSASLQGFLKMEWQILSNGRVRRARAAQDGVGSPTLSDCMRRALSQVRFPSPPAAQIPEASARFVFSM